MTRRTTLFSYLSLIVLAAATACQDGSTTPTAISGGAVAEYSEACTTNSSCSLPTPQVTATISGTVATVSWTPIIANNISYQAKCGAVTGTATCKDGGGKPLEVTTVTFTVGGNGTIQFLVSAHCEHCDQSHVPATGQNSNDGSTTVTIGDPGCQINCDDDGDLKTDATLTITGGTYTYDGASHPAVATCDAENLTVTYTPGPGAPTAAGTYSVSATCGGENWNTATGSATITINKAPVTATAGSGGGVYNGSSFSASDCAISGDYTVGVSCSNSPASAGPGVGTTTVSPSVTADLDNFEVTSVDGSIVITPASVTATAGSASKSYDGSALSAGCSVTGDYIGDLSCANDVASIGPDVGSSVTVPVVSGSTGNFTITSVNGSLSITAAEVTATGGTASKTYDGTELTAACVLSGSYTGGLSCADNSFGPDAGSAASVPVVTGGTSNFNITSVNGTLTINPAEVTATAGSGSKVYDGTVLSAACVISGAYTGGITCANNDGGPGVGSTTTVPVVTGGTSNYNITSVNGQIDITPASLTATAWSGNRTYGQANPTTCTVTGAVNSEVYSCTSSSAANATSPVGSVWATTATMVSNPGLSNYTITYVDGSMTIVAYDLSGCYIAPIYSVMPSTKAFQKKGSVLPIKCVIRDSFGNIVSNATGNLQLIDNTQPSNVKALLTNAYKFTAGTPALYMNQQDTTQPFYIVGHFYNANTTWNDGSVTKGWFYIALK